MICLRQPGITPGQLCTKCDGKCPLCDSFVNPAVPVRICDECAFNTGKRCIVCGMPATVPAFYCRECVRLERDRDGCPVIQNIGTNRADYYFSR